MAKDSPILENPGVTANANYKQDRLAFGNPLIDAITFFDDDTFKTNIHLSNEEYLKSSLTGYYDLLKRDREAQLVMSDIQDAQNKAANLIVDLVYPLPRVVQLYRHIVEAITEVYIKTDWRTGERSGRHKVARGLLICGFNGVGKTVALSAALGQVKQVIIHGMYNGVLFSQIQVVWLRVYAGATDTTKALCRKFFEALDDALNAAGIISHYSTRYRGLTKDAMLSQMKRLVILHRIGLVAFDEVQRVNQYNGTDRSSVIGFLMELVDEINVQVIICGTPPAETILACDPACSGRYDFWAWPTCHPSDWKNYIEWLWQQQPLYPKQPLNVQLFGTITKLSAMIPRVAARIFVKTLVHCIKPNEKITSKLLKAIYEREFQMMIPFLTAVRSKDYEAITKYKNGIDIELLLSNFSLGSTPVSAVTIKKYIHNQFTDCLENPSTYFSDSNESKVESNDEKSTLSEFRFQMF